MRCRFDLALLLVFATAACASKHAGDSSAERAPEEMPVVVDVAPRPPRAPAAANTASPARNDGTAAERRGLPLASCPLTGDAARDPDRLLDTAAKRYDARDWAAAFGCAEIASDLVPKSVEAHHVRASALAQLGHHGAAQVAFSLALALNPDDPETLAAAANFYINILPRLRDTLLVGLAHARRGSRRADSRRRRDRSLRARLWILQAQALTDLGRAAESMLLVDAAIKLSPGMLAAHYERGVALFHLGRFSEARRDLAMVLRRSPDDAYAHYHIGLVYERDRRHTDARAHFRRARDLAPSDFPEPVKISASEFAAELERAVAALPPATRKLLRGVSILPADLPRSTDLNATNPPLSPTILGLFRGLPLGVSGGGAKRVPKRAIVLYRLNLARAVRTREALNSQIRRTLHHEIGHLQGMDEDALRHHGLD